MTDRNFASPFFSPSHKIRDQFVTWHLHSLKRPNISPQKVSPACFTQVHTCMKSTEARVSSFQIYIVTDIAYRRATYTYFFFASNTILLLWKVKSKISQSNITHLITCSSGHVSIFYSQKYMHPYTHTCAYRTPK
jgi:hypothetical protein